MAVVEEKIRFDPDRLAEQLLSVQKQNREMVRLDGWFYIQEIRKEALEGLRARALPPSSGEGWGGVSLPRVLAQAKLFEAVCKRMRLSIRPDEVFAGTQDDAFARTYALINPEFRVETFAGYCDPMAVYGDITPAPELGLTEERIQRVRDFWAKEEYAQALNSVYAETGLETGEVVYFVEQVTGHTVADFRPAMEQGLTHLIERAKSAANTAEGERRDFYEAAVIAMSGDLHLADRYSALAAEMAETEADPVRRSELQRISSTCGRVLREGARDLYEAIQSFILLWMAMAIEQAPNPYAFSVGNLDRILQPFFDKAPVDHEVAVQLTRHLLALFNVGDRNWAISQNIMAGGRCENGHDLTGEMTYVVLDAFFRSNYPQPSLSVKLHSGTPERLYDAMSRFFTTPGSLTPSFFNDDRMFEVLRRKGIEEEDLPFYGIAGCQEPLIMGKESGNTTNSWLNLAKVLELTIHGGKSAISGRKIGLSYEETGLDPRNPIGNPERFRSAFWKQLDYFVPRMAKAANGCTEALALLPVPFLSCFMGGLTTGRDMRDITAKGTKYNASGCLIHGLSIVADSFAAIDYASATAPESLADLPKALLADFEGHEGLRDLLLESPKYGNDEAFVDAYAGEIARQVSARVYALRNSFGNPFLPDWSTPSTHLLYGYWAGATPDGRSARKMLGYGVDPTAGMATKGLPVRIMSMRNLPYEDFLGGYASHIGLDAALVKAFGEDRFGRGLRDYVINPLFGYTGDDRRGGYYVYLNVDTAKRLRKILENPKEMVPSGIYIMRIHGTFVNFLDLSPAIQEDIITRLDPDSTRLAGVA
ncbi:MAG: pyruvate formate lyase family protein [Armatimonadota bacterium]|nr:pyruvate formate lyase family protein [Armatimonadota bacterium]